MLLAYKTTYVMIVSALSFIQKGVPTMMILKALFGHQPLSPSRYRTTFNTLKGANNTRLKESR